MFACALTKGLDACDAETVALKKASLRIHRRGGKSWDRRNPAHGISGVKNMRTLNCKPRETSRGGKELLSTGKALISPCEKRWHRDGRPPGREPMIRRGERAGVKGNTVDYGQRGNTKEEEREI